MLTLYHNQISLNSRRVWIALLEKNLEFDLVDIYYGDQFKPEFLSMNPFHHIPVLVDDGLVVVESLAILDYLEAKYPSPSLMPSNPKDIATVRMVEMVTVNELVSVINPFIHEVIGVPSGQDEQQKQQAKQKISKVLEFLEKLLGDSPYFGSEQLTLADIVAGCTLPLLPVSGFSFADYDKLNAWYERLMQRSSWQTSQVTPEAIATVKSRMAA